MTIKGLPKTKLFDKYASAYSQRDFYVLLNDILPDKKRKKLLTAKEVKKVVDVIGIWEIPIDLSIVR